MSRVALWVGLAVLAGGACYALISADAECQERGGVLVRDAFGGVQCVGGAP